MKQINRIFEELVVVQVKTFQFDNVLEFYANENKITCSSKKPQLNLHRPGVNGSILKLA